MEATLVDADVLLLIVVGRVLEAVTDGLAAMVSLLVLDPVAVADAGIVATAAPEATIVTGIKEISLDCRVVVRMESLATETPFCVAVHAAAVVPVKSQPKVIVLSKHQSTRIRNK